MKVDLAGRVALVTGGSRGIGLSIAAALGESGARVAICARNDGNLEQARKLLASKKIECLAIATDVTREGSAEKVIGEVVGHWGRLDILVNNAGGIPKKGAFFELKDEDWLSVFNLNLMSAVRFSRGAVPHLRKSRNPRIINLSSIVGRQPGQHNPHYAVAKMALLTLTKHLSNLLAPDRILVNAISPGIVQTEGWDESIREKAEDEKRPLSEVTAEENARAKASMPLGRLGNADEIARLALFLASDACEIMTGAELIADGGKHRTI